MGQTIKIRTTGQDVYGADLHRFAYEATPYTVLERLADSGLITENDVILDYGCGKGRVSFFLSYRTRAKSIGLEYDKNIYYGAAENQKTAVSADRVSLLRYYAEDYEVPPEVNRCYFFNPFSAEILEKVMAGIIESCYNDPREILLFFYYPSKDYVSYLMTVDELEYMHEINCRDLFDEGNLRERIMIYRLL
ncbi:MAG: SAM-dependent methyltransferase [Eubacteriales bacterium]|nr:SAM-dependent methyltransferase [Eubacteriales bacterium]